MSSRPWAAFPFDQNRLCFGEQPLDGRTFFIVDVEFQHRLIMSDVHFDDESIVFSHRCTFPNEWGGSARHPSYGGTRISRPMVPIFLTISTVPYERIVTHVYQIR